MGLHPITVIKSPSPVARHQGPADDRPDLSLSRSGIRAMTVQQLQADQIDRQPLPILRRRKGLQKIPGRKVTPISSLLDQDPDCTHGGRSSGIFLSLITYMREPAICCFPPEAIPVFSNPLLPFDSWSIYFHFRPLALLPRPSSD